ncbi:MAG: HlyD family efflux transporter periplasmic adaptor subunit [Lachnospiraceae bacterium]|nr:HlyD family efflux transporter periplasmic adaptor subunit [Lachnospiraceae bacterium]
MDKNKRKDWIKNAIIIFLVVMLILTFCSDSIMNMYLPEVSTEAATQGKIKETVRGTGVAELNQACQLMVDGSRTVKMINVKVGQEVKEGDVIITLEEGDSTELEAAKTAYLDMQTEYQKKLIGTDNNYDKDKLAISAAKEDYEKALKNYNSIDSKNKKLRSMQNKLEKYNTKILEYDNKIAELDAKITELSAKTDADTYNAELTTKQRALVGLNNEKSDLEADLTTLKNAGAPAEEITQKERDIRNKGVEIANTEADIRILEAAITDVSNNVKRLNNAVKEKNDTVNSQNDAKTKQANLSADIETLKASIPTKEEALNIVDEKENTWNNLVADYELKKSEDDKLAESDKIDLKALRQKLIAQKELVEELMENSTGAEVKAVIDGKVTSINVAVGDVTQPNMPVASLSSGKDGYSVSISVTKEQASKVKPGQKAEVENYWYDDITAVLATVVADTETPGNYKLTFAVDGENIVPGDSLTISAGGENKTYDVVVPKSSVYEDNNGKFVLTLDSKNTPLGNRYIATRHNVTVLAEDDINAAISGDLLGYEYVIVTSSEALTSGEQVKLKE